MLYFSESFQESGYPEKLQFCIVQKLSCRHILLPPSTFHLHIYIEKHLPYNSSARCFHALRVGNLYFSKLNKICHLLDHLINVSMSSCSYLVYPHFPYVFLKSLVSPYANFNIFLVIPSFSSLMYIKNRIGPSTDPCGTPLKTGFQFESSPSTTTLCLLPVSHCSIQFIIIDYYIMGF